jgi:hypothetical protein
MVHRVARPKGRSKTGPRVKGMPDRQVAVGLEGALWESGPNHLTDFADALQFEGKPAMSPENSARWEALGRFREALTLFLAGKNAAFIGGVAVRSYGGSLRLPMRPTGDYDLLIDDELLKQMTKFLEGQGGVLDSTDEDTYFFYLKPADLHIDVRTARQPFDRLALSRAKGATFEERKLKIVIPPVLAAMKVKAWSERRDLEKKAIDANDVRGLIGRRIALESEVRDLLLKYYPDLVANLDEILKS